MATQAEFTLSIVEDDDGIDRSSFDIANFRKLAEKALPLILRNPGPYENSLASLEVVEVILVSDETIAEVHGEFLEDPTPTDVITFHHGEILVSTDTATSVASEYGNNPARETLLYIIHGLLHLIGHHDSEKNDQKEMHRIQNSILDSVWPSQSEG